MDWAGCLSGKWKKRFYLCPVFGTIWRMMRFYSFGFWCLLLSLLMPVSARAAEQDFTTWLNGFRAEARAYGISEPTLQSALMGIAPIQRVIDLDRKQPEKKITFAQYRKNIINQARIDQGRAMMRTHARTLSAIEQAYGVAPQYIVALWGIETSYGANTGGFRVIPALATLAWEGRRAEFFKNELLKALRILDEGHIGVGEMKGSWAGAMGQNQFMPSSFVNFAVDGNGDGHKDIWGTEVDVFASAANYLKQNGWTAGQRWGRKVKLPANFSADLVGPKIQKPLSYWSSMGVTDYSGNALPAEQLQASIVAPDGLGGPAYIVYDNYQTIMRWNRSTYFATSVGLLADLIAQ
jgi:membrane-bound lytic murein transglycosylase B